MRFFTPALFAAFDADELALYRAAAHAYDEHLTTLRGVLPEGVLALTEPSGMEDGLIVRVEHDRFWNELTLTLRCGNLIVGYYDLFLFYEKAEVVHDEVLTRIARTTLSDRRYDENLRYQELDVAPDGGIEHRMIFTNASWFAIRCRSLDWERVPRPDRKLPRHRDRYPGAPDIL